MSVTIQTRYRSRRASEIARGLPTTKKTTHLRNSRFDFLTVETVMITDTPPNYAVSKLTSFGLRQF